MEEIRQIKQVRSQAYKDAQKDYRKRMRADPEIGAVLRARERERQRLKRANETFEERQARVLPKKKTTTIFLTDVKTEEEKLALIKKRKELRNKRIAEYLLINADALEKKRTRDLASNMSEERLTKKRAKARERQQKIKFDSDLKEKRSISAKKYQTANKERLSRLSLDRLILRSIGKACPIVVVHCRECGNLETKKEYKSRQGKASMVYCSLHTRKHSHKGEFVDVKKTPNICPDCGVLTMGNRMRKRCDPCGKRRNRKAQLMKPHVQQARKDTAGSHRKRARINGGIYETVNKRIVFDRDKWRCVECGVKVVRSKEWMPNQATIDHTIPLSRGGSHTYGNVRTMCMMCNSKKCDTMPSGVQLTIFERV